MYWYVKLAGNCLSSISPSQAGQALTLKVCQALCPTYLPGWFREIGIVQSTLLQEAVTPDEVCVSWLCERWFTSIAWQDSKIGCNPQTLGAEVKCGRCWRLLRSILMSD
jgi:hypothetical protein